MLRIFNNFIIKNMGGVGGEMCQIIAISLCVFHFQKFQTYPAYVKISLGPRKFGREVVRRLFHNHLHFPVVNFISIAKNVLAISSDLRAISVLSVQAATLREDS